MKRKCLEIGISTVSVILLILASLTNVIGYQTVQSSNPHLMVEQEQKIQSSNSECDCEDENIALWHFPVLCSIIYIPVLLCLILYAIASITHNFYLIEKLERILPPFFAIAQVLNCFWFDAPYFEELQKNILR